MFPSQWLKNCKKTCISIEIKSFEVGGVRGKNWIYKTTQPFHSHMFFPEKLSKCENYKYITDFRKMPYLKAKFAVSARIHFMLVSGVLLSQLGVFQISSTSACFIWNSKLVNHTLVYFQDCCCWNSYWQASYEHINSPETYIIRHTSWHASSPVSVDVFHLDLSLHLESCPSFFIQIILLLSMSHPWNAGELENGGQTRGNSHIIPRRNFEKKKENFTHSGVLY